MSGKFWRCPRCEQRYTGSGGVCVEDGAALMEEGDPLVGRTLCGRYRLLDRIGRGGMADVYRAMHVILRREVAVKVLSRRYADQAVLRQRFIREARAANLVRHEHVINIHDLGEDGEVVFLVMDLLRGESLADRIARGRLGHEELVSLILPVASALARAHAIGVIHRDIKPDNIFLSEEGGRTHVRLLDFGIAHVRDMERVTLKDELIGTSEYFAPEQLFGGHCSPATDLYALGVTLYEALSGRVPFEEPAGSVSLRRLQEAPPELLGFVPSVPTWLGELVMRLIAREPADRPASAASVVDELRRIGDSLRPRAPAEPPNLDALRQRASLARVSIAAGWPASRPPGWVESSIGEVDAHLDALSLLDRQADETAARAAKVERARGIAFVANARGLLDATEALAAAERRADTLEVSVAPLRDRAAAATDAVARAHAALLGAGGGHWTVSDAALAAMLELGREAGACMEARAAYEGVRGELEAQQRAAAEADDRSARVRAAIVAEDDAATREADALRREAAALGRGIAERHRALRVEFELLERYLAGSPGAR